MADGAGLAEELHVGDEYQKSQVRFPRFVLSSRRERVAME